MNNDYIIRPKYCPSLKKNVPIMVFADDYHSEKCWNCERCNEQCSLNYKSAGIQSTAEVKRELL